MKKVITILLSIGTLLHFEAKAQKTVDSLQEALSVVRTDSGKVKLLLAIGDALQNDNSDLVGSKHYYRQAGQLSRKAGYRVGTIEYLFDYSDALVQQGLYDSSLVMNKEAASLAKRISDSARLYRALFNIGVSYSGMENYTDAIRHFLLAAGYYERKAQMDKVGMCANELMILFRETKNYAKAIQYGEKAIKLYRAYRPPQ